MPFHHSTPAAGHSNMAARPKAFASSTSLRNSTSTPVSALTGFMKCLPKSRTGKTLLAGVVLADLAATEWYFWGREGSSSKN
ncbi:hypothetical protein MKZ38_009555 [Zalerion maritima]|uniref:Uncharacterized protein n=1 Tax=Zalerion maritima TaxID=339359 RepID=A0AAD5RU13_9PEZI|nr:hypothetical protein MKZ38_009555 [Zalerion maritima]